ncbi:hypothetical protein B0H19DRAFT_1062412 [Mycena capillaripes]|nr:hypothetical protein B0H19DRAFT_1062412 [Mycena capillaripes]
MCPKNKSSDANFKETEERENVTPRMPKVIQFTGSHFHSAKSKLAEGKTQSSSLQSNIEEKRNKERNVLKKIEDTTSSEAEAFFDSGGMSMNKSPKISTSKNHHGQGHKLIHKTIRKSRSRHGAEQLRDLKPTFLGKDEAADVPASYTLISLPCKPFMTGYQRGGVRIQFSGHLGAGYGYYVWHTYPRYLLDGKTIAYTDVEPFLKLWKTISFCIQSSDTHLGLYAVPVTARPSFRRTSNGHGPLGSSPSCELRNIPRNGTDDGTAIDGGRQSPVRLSNSRAYLAKEWIHISQKHWLEFILRKIVVAFARAHDETIAILVTLLSSEGCGNLFSQYNKSKPNCRRREQQPGVWLELIKFDVDNITKVVFGSQTGWSEIMGWSGKERRNFSPTRGLRKISKICAPARKKQENWTLEWGKYNRTCWDWGIDES